MWVVNVSRQVPVCPAGSQIERTQCIGENSVIQGAST